MKTRAILFLSALSFSCAACQTAGSPLKLDLYLFDTLISVTLYEGSEENLSAIEETLRRIDGLTDPFNSYDEPNVCAINNLQDGETTTISQDLADLVLLADEYRETLDGYFNPWLGELTFLYKKRLPEGKTVTDEEIKEALSKVALTNYSIDNLIYTKIGEAQLDLGAIAKGYALEKTAEYLKNNAISHYLLNFGSSSIAVGQKTDGSSFRVKLRDIDAVLNLKDTGLSVSAVSEQLYKIAGVYYSHLVNPFTGEAEVFDRRGAIYLGDEYAFGDAFATALMFMDEEAYSSWDEKGASFAFYGGDGYLYQSGSYEKLLG